MSPNVYMVSNGYTGCCYVRLLLPAFHNGFMSDRPSVDAPLDDPKKVRAEIAGADVVVFHRPEQQEYHDLAKLLKSEGKKIVMDNDDTFKLGYHPLAKFTPDGLEVTIERRAKNIDKFLKIADLVTTTTKTLANEYREHNDNVIVLPNCVDTMDWDEPLRNETDIVRIGLVGTVAHAQDYGHIKDIIRNLDKRKDVQIVMFGLGDKKHRKDNPRVVEVFKEDYKFWDSLDIEHTPWCPISDYPTKLNEARLDMMLIPREDNYFNRCKSNIKFLEASMCEIPVIAQSFKDGPYEELVQWETGVKIKDNKEWANAIERLIIDKDTRRNIGKHAKEYTLNNYNIEVRHPEWDVAYRKLYEDN